MMDDLIIAVVRIEARAAAAVRAFGGWWFASAVGRGLHALARREEKSVALSAGRRDGGEA
ncbi:hypothetical protein [Paracoccus suum]|uniref:hypothetical protein n=1 Tax=Paracoccus suum TaxID=2259340 RepID=UPI0013B05DD0|nr:hypothetical protein [Paracoccus suum]